MRKILALVLSCAMVLSLTTWGNDDKSESKKYSDKKTFTVGFDAEYPPYGYMDEDGEYIGFDLELSETVCEMEGWELVKTPIDWNSKDFELNNGNIDCIWNGFTMNGREDDYAWTDPYFNNSQVFVVKADSNISSVEDLKGKDIDVEMGSSAIAALENNKDLKDDFANIYEITEYDTSFMDLESGTCDAVLGDCDVMKYIINTKYNEEDYRILETPLSLEQYGVGFAKDNTELRDQVQETLNEMYEDGTIDKIAQKYKDYGIPEGVIYP